VSADTASDASSLNNTRTDAQRQLRNERIARGKENRARRESLEVARTESVDAAKLACAEELEDLYQCIYGSSAHAGPGSARLNIASQFKILDKDNSGELDQGKTLLLRDP
jgi:hypothetical protein